MCGLGGHRCATALAFFARVQIYPQRRGTTCTCTLTLQRNAHVTFRTIFARHSRRIKLRTVLRRYKLCRLSTQRQVARDGALERLPSSREAMLGRILLLRRRWIRLMCRVLVLLLWLRRILLLRIVRHAAAVMMLVLMLMRKSAAVESSTRNSRCVDASLLRGVVMRCAATDPTESRRAWRTMAFCVCG